MKKRTYLSAGLALLIGTLSVHASPGLSDVKSRVLPAVYKSKNGLTQKVEISVKHEGVKRNWCPGIMYSESRYPRLARLANYR